MTAPVITLTTDFGLSDHYVAAMKAVLLTRIPDVRIVDVTHDVPRHSILAGSFLLERAIASFPAGTIHVAVVDPGVGSARRILVTEIHSQLVICPDNGLITWAWHSHPGAHAHELIWRPATVPSHTFHGRDIMTPAAAQLATGTPLQALTTPISDPLLFPIRPSTTPHGQIIHIDHFGNCTTNIPAHILPPSTTHVRAGPHTLPLHRTYSDVPPGSPLALIGSSNLLEIATNSVSAAEQLDLRIGTGVSAGPLD